MSDNAQHAIDGVTPDAVLRPGTAEALAEELKRASSEGKAVLPVGQRTRLGIGGPSGRIDTVIETTALARIITYEPGDLTVTVEAGIGLAELGRTLGENEQRLPLQAYRGRGTLGGLIATGADGALDLRSGRVRDLLIGAKIALTDGSLAKGRGAVVKNVAGYDVPRLVAGSLGTLGVIVEASFRLEPRPPQEAAIVFDFASMDDGFEASRLAFDSQLEPSFLNVISDRATHRFAAGFDGSEARVRGQLQRLADIVAGSRPRGQEVLEGAANTSLRRTLDDPCVISEDGGAERGTVRVILRLTASPALVAGVVVSASRAVTDETGSDSAASANIVRIDARPACGVAFIAFEAENTDTAIRAIANVRSSTTGAALLPGAGRSVPGPGASSAVVVSAPLAVRRAVDVWGPAPGDMDLMRLVKTAFDPSATLAAGRFVGGL